MANICEYFELNDSHLQISPLELSMCRRECSLLKTGLILVLQYGGRLLLCGQNIRCYTTQFLCNTQLYLTCPFW